VQEAHVVLEINPNYDEVHVCLALSELAQGRPDQAAEIYRDKLMPISRRAESLALLGLADVALYEGRLAKAKELLETGIALDLEVGQEGYAAYKRAILAHTQLLLGDRGFALAAADQAINDSQSLCLKYFVAQTYIEAGVVHKAQNLAVGLAKQLQPEPRACGLLIAGEAKVARREIPEAIELFQQAQGLLETWIGHFALGRAYLEAGAFTEAHAEFEWCLNHHGEATSLFFDDFPSYRYFPPVHYYLGLAQEGLGSSASAESFQKFLGIKEKADDEEPLVADAQRRLDNN
jgi:tetratricopeptide (TPR) repeat protein